MLFLQQAREDYPTEKKVVGWQDGFTVHLLFSMHGDRLEGCRGENMMYSYNHNYHYDYQFHKNVPQVWEIGNGEKL